MATIDLTITQLLKFIIYAIEHKKYQEAIDLAQDCINKLGEKNEK